MVTLAFDTHKAVKALQEAGAAEPLAEAVVATVGEAVGENVTTKADLAEVKAALEADIAEVKAALEADIATARAELKADLAEVKAALEADIATARAESKTDIAAVREEMAKGFQGVYKFMVASTLTIAGTIIGAAIVLVRYLAPQ